MKILRKFSVIYWMFSVHSVTLDFLKGLVESNISNNKTLMESDLWFPRKLTRYFVNFIPDFICQNIQCPVTS